MLQTLFQYRIFSNVIAFVFSLLLAPFVLLNLGVRIHGTFLGFSASQEDIADREKLFPNVNQMGIDELLFAYAQHPCPLLSDKLREKHLPLGLAKLICAFVVWPGLCWSETIAGIALADEWDDIYGPSDWVRGVLQWTAVAGLFYFF